MTKTSKLFVVLIIFVIAAIFFSPSEAEAAVAFDATSTARFDVVSSFSYTHTPVGTPTTAVVEVGIRGDGINPNATVSSITYGGVAMTFVRRDQTALVQNSEVWVINNPLSGARTVAVTLSAVAEGASIAVTVTGSATSGQPANHAGATGSDAAPTVTVTSATGRLVLGFVQSERANTDAQITPVAGQTQRASIDGPTLDRPRMEATDEAGAASVVTSWTLASARSWAAQAIDLSEPAAGDSSPPTPNPMTWASAPNDTGTSTINMSSTVGSDATTPVNYLFTSVACTANGGTGNTSSSWQTGTTYTDSGLQANQCYAYTVTARDSVATPNTGTASASSSAYTAAAIPGTPTLSGATTSTLNFSNDDNGNPTASPATEFAVFVSSTSPTDSRWQGFWVNAAGTGTSTTEVWRTDSQWNLTISNLATSTTYNFKVKARNFSNENTVLGAAGSGTTQSGAAGSCGLSNISATSTEHWAWNDFAGWMDFCNTQTVIVSSQGIAGYASSSAGDVSLDCATTRNGNICGTSNYQVINNGAGNLSGWGWNDLYGWISFCGGQGTSNCPGSIAYAVRIDSNGNFNDYAWNDAIGWISFNCLDIGVCGTSNYKVNTSWVATSTSATLDSSTFDTGVATGAQLNSVLWHGDRPLNTAVRFQFATSNSPSGPWTYKGTDGTASTYYSVDKDTSLKLDYGFHNNFRYFRYRVTLSSDSAQQSTPRVDEIIVSWSP